MYISGRKIDMSKIGTVDCIVGFLGMLYLTHWYYEMSIVRSVFIAAVFTYVLYKLLEVGKIYWIIGIVFSLFYAFILCIVGPISILAGKSLWIGLLVFVALFAGFMFLHVIRERISYRKEVEFIRNAQANQAWRANQEAQRRYQEEQERITRERERWEQQQRYKAQQEQAAKESANDLFSGCNDRESVVKRYHQLMKIYHPDNQNGDTTMSQKLQEAYDRELKKY